MARPPEPLYLTTSDRLYLDVPVEAIDANGAPVNLSGYPGRLALVPRKTKPTSKDWKPATWNAAADQLSFLVGPGGGVEYAAGKYVAWWSVTGVPEAPARPAPSPENPRIIIFREA